VTLYRAGRTKAVAVPLPHRDVYTSPLPCHGPVPCLPVYGQHYQLLPFLCTHTNSLLQVLQHGRPEPPMGDASGRADGYSYHNSIVYHMTSDIFLRWR